MKKIWKEELSLQELNEEVKKVLKKLNKPKCNKAVMLLSAAVILALFGALVFVLIKRKCGKCEENEFEDDFGYDEDSLDDLDENGCRYTDDDDFEEVK